MKYWLVKSEPNVFSFNDLKKCKNQSTGWDGVRNYQARNFIRDEMKLGDRVLFYHSNSKPTAIMGICYIVKEAYPDMTAFDLQNIHFDPKSRKQKPTWFMVDIKLEKEFAKPITLSEIKQNPKLGKMKLLQRGNRLSVMPVTNAEFKEIVKISSQEHYYP